jgi:hypothetical protein
MRKIFVDTGGWYAAAASRDRDHEAAKHFLSGNHLPLMTSDYIMDETVTLLQSRLGHRYAVKFLDALHRSRQMELVHLSKPQIADAVTFFRSRPDKGWSFTDCTSFVLMREQGIECAFAFDEHFQQAGFQLLPQQSLV